MNINLRSSLLLIAIIGFFVANAALKFNNLKVRDGMELYEVSAIYKDTLGYIWIGNSKGLSRYDGRNVKTYPIKDEIRSFVSDIKEVDQRKLLLCSKTGLFEFDKQKGEFNTLVKYNDSIAPYCIETSPDKETYYIGTLKFFDVYEFSKNKIHRYFIKRDGDYVSIRDIYRDITNSIWIASTNGLFKFNSFTHKISLVSSDKIRYINDIQPYKNVLFVGTENGLFSFNTNTFIENEIPDFHNKIITAISPERKSIVYISTNGFGVMRYDVEKKSILDYITHDIENPESLPSNSIYRSLYDRDGILWVGTFSSGVCYSHKFERKFHTFNYGGNQSFQKQAARSICVYGDLKLIGTRDGLIVSEKSGKSTIYGSGTSLEGLRANIILRIIPYPGKPGLFLLGTYGGGVSVFDVRTRKFSPFIPAEPLLYAKVYGMSVDPAGFVWIATFDGLIKCDVKQVPKIVSVINGMRELNNNKFWCLYTDRLGNIWTCTDNGLAVYSQRSSRFIKPTQISQIVKERVVCVFEDYKKDTWVCTLTAGIYVFDSNLKLVRRITAKDGLPDNNVVSVEQDKSGNYWIATMNGFSRYSNGTLHTFSLSDGLSGKIFLPASSTMDRYGNIWMGTETGLMYFNPQYIVENKIKPVTAISDIKINDVESEPVLEEGSWCKYKNIDVEGAENSLKVEFVALSYYNSEDNKFKFKLIGVDKEWRSAEGTNSVEYKDLPSGHYTFVVFGSNNDGVWSENEVVLPITVTYYFYQTIWFFALCFIVLVGLVYWVFTYYFSRAADKIKKQVLASLPVKPKKELQKPKIEVDRSREVLELVKKYMREEKPYLDVELKFSKVAEVTSLQQIEISQVLSQFEGLSFADFVNRYRVEEFIERISNRDDDNLKITAIAFECGFYSKASFYRAFKKETGLSPGEYFKKGIPDE